MSDRVEKSEALVWFKVVKAMRGREWWHFLHFIDCTLGICDPGTMHLKELRLGKVDDVKPVGKVVGGIGVLRITHGF